MSKLRTTVGAYKGLPRLFINGEPATGICCSHKGFLFRRLDGAYDTARRLRREGIAIFRDTAMIVPQADGGLDTSMFDQDLAGLLEVDPDILFMARIPLPQPPDWWTMEHPDELMVHRDPYTGETVRVAPHHVRASFSSEFWRRDVCRWVEQIVTYCEQHHGETIMGYFLHGGIFEWAYSWAEVLSDYSPAQTRGFRRWLRERYGDDLSALREAWGDGDVRFDTAAVPVDRARLRPETPALLDPETDRRIIDYLTYHSHIVAESLIELAGCVKSTLRRLGSEKVVGTWYGYEFWPAGHAGHYHNSGHHAMEKVLACEDIDFFSLIHSHFERKPAGLWVHHMPGSSVVAHGRLLYGEDDTATHVAEDPVSWQQFCRTPRESEGVLSRNFMGALSTGGSVYWHDFSGERWFADDEVATHIGRLVCLFEHEFGKQHRNRCQVAGFVSKRSKRYFRQDAALTDGVYCRQISELLHVGAPVDVYYAEDIPMLLERGRLERYRAAVFFDGFDLSNGVREAIRVGLACGGRTLIWCYGAGFVTPGGFSAEKMHDLTGIPVQIGREGQTLKAETHYTGTLLRYGVNANISPVFKGLEDADEDIATWGWYVQPESPALMTRQFAEWRSIWTGAPALPSTVLRKMLREAGVHIYTGTGDQAFAVNDLLAVHACFSGTRTIELPCTCEVVDALSGETTANLCSSFDWKASRADTGIWRLHAGT
jgi:hypothetical protein